MSNVTAARAQEILKNLKTNPSRQILVMRAIELKIEGKLPKSTRDLADKVRKAAQAIAA